MQVLVISCNFASSKAMHSFSQSILSSSSRTGTSIKLSRCFSKESGYPKTLTMALRAVCLHLVSKAQILIIWTTVSLAQLLATSISTISPRNVCCVILSKKSRSYPRRMPESVISEPIQRSLIDCFLSTRRSPSQYTPLTRMSSASIWKTRQPLLQSGSTLRGSNLQSF